MQPVQGGAVSRTERGMASLAAKGLDALSLAMLAIAHQRMDVGVSVAKIGVLRVGTGTALGVDTFGGSPPAYDLAPGTYRSRSRSHTRRVGAGEVTGGAIVWGTGLEQTGEHGAFGCVL